MAIPDYEMIMLPLLQSAEDGIEHNSRDIIHKLSEYFNLTEEEKSKLYETKKVSIFYDRVHWALTYLKHAGLLKGTRRGHFQITDRGQDVLRDKPQKIDDAYLTRFIEFTEFIGVKKKQKQIADEQFIPTTSDKTPYELIESSYKIVREDLVTEILNNVKKSSPQFFESIVVELLVSMGYGGSVKDAGQAVGKSGDEGIDGIIKEDILGLDVIHVQAKRWDNPVGRPEIQKFAGALQGKRSKKGIFITTGKFSNDSINYTMNIDSKIVLIDGEQLAEYMIDHNIGVNNVKEYVIKKIDSDYFEEQM